MTYELRRDMRVNWADEKHIDVSYAEPIEDEIELDKELDRISKIKPFIKWLCKNNKVDCSKLDMIVEVYHRKGDFNYCPSDYETLIMTIINEDDVVEYLSYVLM